MDRTKLGLRVELTRYIDKTGKFLKGHADFFSNGVNLDEERTVNCSRSGKGCPTRIDDLQSHNDHKPGFPTEVEMNAWVQRIQEDVNGHVDAYEGKFTDPATETGGNPKWN